MPKNKDSEPGSLWKLTVGMSKDPDRKRNALAMSLDAEISGLENSRRQLIEDNGLQEEIDRLTRSLLVAHTERRELDQ